MRVRRALARLCGRDARAPGDAKPAPVSGRSPKRDNRLLDSRFRGNDGSKDALRTTLTPHYSLFSPQISLFSINPPRRRVQNQNFVLDVQAERVSGLYHRV